MSFPEQRLGRPMCHSDDKLFVCHLGQELQRCVVYNSDAISRAYRIVDNIPGRATGAYSHSQVYLLIAL